MCKRTLFSVAFDSVFTVCMIIGYFYIVSCLSSTTKVFNLFNSSMLSVFVLGHGVVQYFNVASAIYAKYKLHGFQYPPGNRIAVSFIDDGNSATE